VPQGALSILDAAPAYLGGKRKLAPSIFHEVALAVGRPPPAVTLADAFMGGGSIALIGKALGYRVVANDVSARSEAVGKALIENDQVTLSQADVATCLLADHRGWHMPEVKSLPWPDPIRVMLAKLCAGAEEFAQPAKRQLARTLMLKVALRISMWGQVKSEAGRRVRAREWDRLTPGMAKALGPFTKPHRELLQALEDVGRGVFRNGRANEMHRADVLEFLAGPGAAADVVYLDPPYPGTLSYEDQYHGLDELLENREIVKENSRFTARQGWEFLGEVYDAAEPIPVWVLSLGNAVVDVGTLVGMMEERGRRVTAKVVRYTHLAAQSSARKNETNEEYLVIATRGGSREG
jgi:adenine-specific DNA-methyltransferase